jgi:hypothetical protein
MMSAFWLISDRLGAPIQIELDSDSLICPSCQNVAVIVVDRRGKSPAQ